MSVSLIRIRYLLRIISKRIARDYIISYGEDEPDISIFHNQETGFVEQPSDFYIRPYIMACQNEFENKSTSKYCYGDRLTVSRVLNHAEQVAIEFGKSNTPYFGFYFTSKLTHNILESMHHADGPHLELFQKLFENPKILNNTLLLFYGDHGLRVGPIRVTQIGQQEDSMPFINIWLPPWFCQMYPEVMNNLQINVKRLTTPFDIHQTLKQVLNNNFNGEYSKMLPSGQVAYSLFDQVPDTRTCKDAGIPETWCTCHESCQITNTDSLIESVVNCVIGHINNYVSNYNQCSILQLKKIYSAMSINQEKGFTSSEYRVTFQTTPGNAVFESAVRKISGPEKCQLLGKVIRINLYKNVSDCIDDHKLKSYCICK